MSSSGVLEGINTFMKTHVYPSLVSLFLIGVFSLSSCCSDNSAPDTKYLNQFHESNFSSKVTPIKSDDLSLYVDYSTCIKEGQHSAFFQSLVPSFVDATKSYYSIKGPNIQKEENIDIYRELRNIVEVNYADLKNAAIKIANADSEGVLLTDGEYFQNDIARGNINNPYLAEPFKIWLKKGHDIYILAEPYVERHSGNSYNKKRFYFLFTDNRLSNNIYDRICQTVKLEDYPTVEIFHLSADHPTVMAEGKSLKVNPTLSASVKPCGNYEIQDWSIDWEAIESVILGAVNPDTGEPLPNGECVIGGLKVDRNSYGGFRITDIDVNVYDINYDYFNNYNEQEAPTGMFAMSSLTHSPYSFIYDKEEFNNHGVVNLYMDASMWTPSNFLTGCPFNYTKIDICVSKCENVFDNYSAMFNFDAIGLSGQYNVSVTESVKQCLFDPEIQEMMNSAVLYTIYIKSNKY
jgi:hypothetical protein